MQRIYNDGAVKDGLMGMVGREGVNMRQNPEGHLFGDLVVTVWDGFMFSQHVTDDGNKVNLDGSRQENPSVGEEVASGSDESFCSVGSDGGASNDVVLDEGGQHSRCGSSFCGGNWELGSVRWCLRQKATQSSSQVMLVFAGLVPLNWATLLQQCIQDVQGYLSTWVKATLVLQLQKFLQEREKMMQWVVVVMEL